MAAPAPFFWSQQCVLLTGHTGFKGAWMSLWLEHLGAETIGLALPPETEPNLFSLLQPFPKLKSKLGDVRDYSFVAEVVAEANPTIVIHMAAQPLVRRSYRDPITTFATNVMGTAHLLEALRGVERLRAVLIVTTDKVYLNLNKGRPFVETDTLGGHDPYSGSKVAAEMVAKSWANSFFVTRGTPVATARAGNVIGGGDWSDDRLIPDLWRALKANKALELRYPDATRPWQHVLDPLAGYLTFVERLATADRQALPTTLNFGPRPDDTLTVAEVADKMLSLAQSSIGWVRAGGPRPAEMDLLSLDPTLASTTLGWTSKLSAREALGWAVEWYRAIDSGVDPRSYSLEQIQRYEKLQ